MLKIIGISGKPGSQKMIYAFKIIQELRFHGYKTHLISLAAPLYIEFNEIADFIKSGNTLEETSEKFNLGENAETLFNLLKNGDLGEKNPEYGYSRRNETVRKGLNTLGSAIRRGQDEDYFVKKLFENLPEGEFGVLIDLRFPNEADFINDSDGLVLRAGMAIESTEGGFKYQEGMNDLTETALDDYDQFFDYLNFEDFSRVDFAKTILDCYSLEAKEEVIR